jgi:Xaa-Pro aminopeptidase
LATFGKDIDKNTRIGIDASLISAGKGIFSASRTLTNCSLVDAENLKKSLEPRNSELVSFEKNLVDIVWAQERPARPKGKIFPLDIKYSGESSEDKLSRVREELNKKKVKAMVINLLDEIAWLFNLRGADIDFNPGQYSQSTKMLGSNSALSLSVFFSYAIITHEHATLFVDSAQVDVVVRNHLGPEVEIKPYDAFFPYLMGLADSLGLKEVAVRLLLCEAVFPRLHPYVASSPW